MIVENALVSATGKAIGRFHVYESGTPVIQYFKQADDLENAKTLIHELVHYVHWVMKGRPAGGAWQEFKAATWAFEKSEDVFEKIATIVMELAK